MITGRIWSWDLSPKFASYVQSFLNSAFRMKKQPLKIQQQQQPQKKPKNKKSYSQSQIPSRILSLLFDLKVEKSYPLHYIKSTGSLEYSPPPGRSWTVFTTCPWSASWVGVRHSLSIYLWTAPQSERRTRARTGGAFPRPASLTSPCNAPGGIAETRSGNISRRKENCIEGKKKKKNLQNIHNTAVKHPNTKREEAAADILWRVWAFGNT